MNSLSDKDSSELPVLRQWKYFWFFSNDKMGMFQYDTGLLMEPLLFNACTFKLLLFLTVCSLSEFTLP